MKIALVLFIVITRAVISNCLKCKQYTGQEIDSEFDEITKKHTKELQTVEGNTKKSKSATQRKSLSKKKMFEVNKKNAENPSFCQGPNIFATMDEEEFKSGYLGKLPSNAGSDHFVVKRSIYGPVQALPATVDHSENTGPVEHQGGCGSCWAFAASHSITGTMAVMKNFPVMPYSEQQLVDCSVPKGWNGCQGADAFYGYEFLTKNEFKTDLEYPYRGRSGKCNSNSTGSNYLLKGWEQTHRLWDTEVSSIKEQLAIQPMAVAMYVVSSFQSYKHGVYDETNCKSGNESLNHDMTLVGYGIDSVTGDPYWKIKNSWGTDNFGENGYVRVKMGSNVCNVETDTRFPIPADTVQPPDATPTPPEETTAGCVDEVEQCAYYGSPSCVFEEYAGDKDTTINGDRCTETCRTTTEKQAPWCTYMRGKKKKEEYCFVPCD